MPRLRSIFPIDPDVVIAASVVQKATLFAQVPLELAPASRGASARGRYLPEQLCARRPQRTESIVRHAKCVVNRVRLCNELRLDRTGDDKAAFLGGRQREHQFAV